MLMIRRRKLSRYSEAQLLRGQLQNPQLPNEEEAAYFPGIAAWTPAEIYRPGL
jgi:hypothetical protein